MTIYVDAAQPIDVRVKDLLSKMTLDEKLAQIVGVWVTDLIDDNREFSEVKAQKAMPHGAGQITRVGASSLLPPPKSAALANTIQRFLIEQTRLGIPAIVHEESCAGYMARGATTFPQAIGLAATWEPELIYEMADAIRHQMRSVGAHQTLAPDLDIVRDPRWGRVEETFGEDSFLVTAYGLAYVNGIQSDDLREGIAATGKHFLAHGIPEGGLNWAPVHVSSRELRDVYATPFAAVIRDANIATMMNAYHELDGEPCGGSKFVMRDLLRGELGFEGPVVADYFTLDMLYQYHRVARDKGDAARLGLEAGIDIEYPARDCYGDPLREAIEAGKIDLALIDESVSRLLKLKFQLGLFENPYVETGNIPEIMTNEADLELSRKLAQKSIVLLKNADNFLPLSPDIKSIAVIGPAADSIRLLQGDYHYPSHLESIFFATEASMEAPNPLQNLSADNIQDHFPPSVSVLEGIKSHVSSDTTVHYAQGCEVLTDDKSGFDAAMVAAQKADVVVMVMGDRSGLAPGCTVGESLDRAELGLPGIQQELVEAVYAVGKPIIMVLLNGRPLTLPRMAENVTAILEAWLPAQEGGNAIADVIFGAVNPGGRLPMSFPRAMGQIPVFYSHKPSGGRSHWKGEYLDMTAKPLFPFGFGLSYTQFSYGNLKLSATEVRANDTIEISVDVQNTGDRAGDEVVQLYLQDIVGSVTRPVKELRGFKRITLQPDEKRTLTFRVPVSHVAFHNVNLDFVVEPGTVNVMVGSSSEDIHLTAEFEIIGEVTEVERSFVTDVTCA